VKTTNSKDEILTVPSYEYVYEIM